MNRFHGLVFRIRHPRDHAAIRRRLGLPEPEHRERKAWFRMFLFLGLSMLSRLLVH